jgi:hypothetical protein
MSFGSRQAKAQRPFFCAIFVVSLVFVFEARGNVGDFPVVNTLQSQGVFGLNFSSRTVGGQLALFLINSNHPNGFDVTFTFANKGKFMSGTHSIPMTNICLNRLSGTIGTGLTAPVNQAVTLDPDGIWVWDPGASQSTETVNLLLEMKCDWPDTWNYMAGFYSETITATISVGL